MAMKRIKAQFWSLVYSSPKLAGWSAFLIGIVLTLFISMATYQLKVVSEREIVQRKLNEFKSLFTDALNDGISAVKTLAYIAENQHIDADNFESIAQQIRESNPHVDVIQYLEKGTIVAVSPLEGNESMIGYDVLSEPNTKLEMEEAIRRKDIYFSGPFRLRQGKLGIVGRYPLYRNGEFVASTAVVFFLDNLLKIASSIPQEENSVEFQLSKTDPNTGMLQQFILGGGNEHYTGYEASTFMDIGNWKLSARLKESTASKGLIVMVLISIFISTLLGHFAWNFARQPSLLRKTVDAQSEEILRANERFELAGRATSDVIWDWDLITDKVYRSDNFYNMFGYEKAEFVENNQFWQSMIHPDDRELVKNRLWETLEGIDQYWVQELRVRKGDGTYAYIIDKGFIIRNTEGKAVRMIGASQDITERKAAELELMELNQRLTSANEELKVFATVASHDLREPLRMISSFMALLEKKYGSTLDEKANQYISFAIDGAKRLTALITDLLEYSRVGFDSSLIEDIDTNELVNQALKIKSNIIRENNALITVERLPPIKGVRVPLQLVFQNLIGNALKYRNKTDPPHILITGRELEDFWEFSISDNGIGIEADYLEFIFRPSKRIHSQEKYPGSGMGLATCRKIVTQHEGRIWVESTPGLGSKFSFTIKKMINKPFHDHSVQDRTGNIHTSHGEMEENGLQALSSESAVEKTA
jgi:PAS domain S-box-containing protein